MEVIHNNNNIIEDRDVWNVYNKIAFAFSITRANKWDWITSFVTCLPKGCSILDIGCGNGRNMIHKGYNFKGIDASDEFVKICKEKDLDVVLADMCSIPYKSESFEHAISIASFHHLSTVPRRILALREVHRILKPNGRVLMSIWSKEQPKESKRQFENYGDVFVPWKNRDETYNRYYYIFRLDEIKDLFDKCNFKIIKHEWIYGNEIFILEKK